MKLLKNKKTIKIAFLLSAILLLVESPVLAQQYSPWTPAENLGSTINTAVTEGCPFISKNNLSLFFASNRPNGFGLNDIYVSTRDSESAVWGIPVNLGPEINRSGNDICPTLTISGRYLYFASNRAGGCGGDDIYVARRLDKKSFSEWGEPVNLGCQFNSGADDITPSLFTDEDGTTYLYFSSNRVGGMGGMDIYVSAQLPDGTFGVPTPVTELNTQFNDQRPDIRQRDGLEIFFESNRTGTIGLTDIYSATRDTTSSAWLTPQNLGAAVNGIAADGRPSLSWDATELYFMSTRSTGFGGNDIYVTRRSKITGQ